MKRRCPVWNTCIWKTNVCKTGSVICSLYQINYAFSDPHADEINFITVKVSYRRLPKWPLSKITINQENSWRSFWLITGIFVKKRLFWWSFNHTRDHLDLVTRIWSKWLFSNMEHLSLSFLTGKLYCQYPFWTSYNPLSCFSIQMIRWGWSVVKVCNGFCFFLFNIFLIFLKRIWLTCSIFFFQRISDPVQSQFQIVYHKLNSREIFLRWKQFWKKFHKVYPYLKNWWSRRNKTIKFSPKNYNL